jgi:hypothetical protein
MLPPGEKSRKAVRWISDSIQDSDSAHIKTLVHQAIFKFDLNPRESEALLQFYKHALEK